MHAKLNDTGRFNMEQPTAITLSYNNPILLLEQWRTSDEPTKLQIKDQYIAYWRNQEEYLPDLFAEHLRKTKETHWHYWWKNIGLLQDQSLRSIWLDKWFNALGTARLRREIGIETELLENTKYWVWPDDREEFFCEFTTLLVQDFMATRAYNSDVDPLYVHIAYPGVGSGSEAWRVMVHNLVNNTYPRPTSALGKFNQAKLWILASAKQYKGANEIQTLPIPEIEWFKSNPYIWAAIFKHKLSINKTWETMSKIEQLVDKS